MRVLIVTWAPRRFGAWLSFLEREGLESRFTAPERRELRQVLQPTAPEVVILDLADGDVGVGEFRQWLEQLCPGMSIGLIAAVPRHGMPVLADEEVDDVVALAAAPEEVACRVRRVGGRRGSQPPAIELGELTLQPTEALALVAGRPVALRRREFELLCFLASRPNRVFRREALVREVWGPEYQGSPRTVDMHVRRLRDRLGDFGRRHLQTVRGVGYRMAAPP